MFNPLIIDPLTLPSLPLGMRSHLPCVGGVYFALDSLGNVQYIGRSVNLHGRWTQHHRQSYLEKLEGVQIAWLVIDTPELLSEIEAALINLYKPSLNRNPKVVTKRSCSEPTKFSRVFKEVMFRYRLSAVEIANISGLTAPQISRFRNGGNLRIDSLEKLLWALPTEAYHDFFKLYK